MAKITIETAIKSLMVYVPDLVQAKPTLFEGHFLPERFRVCFTLFNQDMTQTWEVTFTIEIMAQGSPKLSAVEVVGLVRPHPKPTPSEQILNFITLEELFSPEAKKLSAMHPLTSAEVAEYIDAMPERASVERWQLKFVEQNRFQLFELSIEAAVNTLVALIYKDGGPTGKKMQTIGTLAPHYLESIKNRSDSVPIFNKVPDGDGLKFWWTSNMPKLDDQEVKKLQRQIDIKIRKKISPEFLMSVAEIYKNAAENNENPIKAVMENFKCKHRTAQDYATKARKLEFLPLTTQGVASSSNNKGMRFG